VVVNDNTAPIGVPIDALTTLAFRELKTLVFEGSDDTSHSDIAKECEGWVFRSHVESYGDRDDRISEHRERGVCRDVLSYLLHIADIRLNSIADIGDGFFLGITTGRTSG